MPLVCPRTCGRLATGAVFISVGVVQLIAAVILLKSKYVYLLSAPNIWTALSNIVVGGLLGVSAGVWKNTNKGSLKHAVRRNILAALMTSAILMNTTTAVLLIMGEGNTLLSIHLENNGIHSSATLASEILAYAYAASVCSPILAVVVAFIFLSGMCFPKSRKSFDMKSILESGSSNFNWVYNTGQRGLPVPDPEIVRRALSTAKSFAPSDSSYSPTEFPDIPDSAHDLHTLKKGIYKIANECGSAFPRTTHRPITRAGNCADTVSRSGNRVSCIYDPSASDRTTLKRSQTDLESDSGRLCSPPKPRTKKRGDLYALIYDAPRNVSRNEELPNHAIARSLDTSVTAADGTSVVTEPDDSMPPEPVMVSEETGYSPPDVENFGKNLRGFEHEHLRRTSTTAYLNYMIEMLDEENSQSDVFFKSTTKSPDPAIVHKAIPGDISSTLEQNSNRDLTDASIDSRKDSFLGEVVPIRVNVVPRKTLPAKLTPASIPIVPNVRNEFLSERKECKFDGGRAEGFSSFHVGHQVKNRLKSARSYSAKRSEPTFAVPIKVPATELPVDETNLQVSPAHTSGYISVLEDTGESSSRQQPSKSNQETTSNSSTFGANESSSYVTARKKFRAAQRKILDGSRPLLQVDAINDIVMQMISENPEISNKESITELFQDLILQKVAHQSEKDDY